MYRYSINVNDDDYFFSSEEEGLESIREEGNALFDYLLGNPEIKFIELYINEYNLGEEDTPAIVDIRRASRPGYNRGV